MATTVWKGHLTFGLVSIPIKLYRAARAEKVSFRQLHASTGARVRQVLAADRDPKPEWKPALKPALPPSFQAANRRSPEPEALVAPSREMSSLKPRLAVVNWEPAPEPLEEISRSEIVKGYEYQRDQYVALTREELAAITPQTAREMQIVEFVQMSEVDPIYYETSYYAAPDASGVRAYSLLFEALRQSGLVGVAQIAMHNREHVVIIRPGPSGLILHTMFYDSEIRRNDEYRTDLTGMAPKELELALRLISNLTVPFEPGKYRDTYREKLDALIRAKVEGNETIPAPSAKPTPAVNILQALERSLQASKTPAPRPPVSERATSPAASGRSGRRQAGPK